MKLILLVLTLLFIFPLSLSAEGGLNKPIVNINGQPVATEYVVDQQLAFTLTDAKKTTISTLKGTKYEWLIGEKTVLTGPSVTYTFTQPGTYQVTVSSTTSPGSPQTIDMFKISVLPSSDYKRPVPKISVNNVLVEEKIALDFNYEIHFSGQHSVVGSAPIVKYEWNFGDKQTGEGRDVAHSYWAQHYNAKPTLRLTDQNGLQSEVTLELLNQPRQASVASTTPNPKKPSSTIVYAILAVIATNLLIVLLVVRRRSISSLKSGRD